MRIGVRGLAAMVAFVVLGGAYALAAQSVGDGRDAGSSMLDLKRVNVGASGDAVAVTLQTHKPFETGYLQTAGSSRYACVYFWFARSNIRKQSDVQVCAKVVKGKLSASVYSKAAGKVVDVGVKASRAGKRGLRFTIPKSVLGGTGKYFWLAGTRDGAKRTFDIVPNAGPRKAGL